MSSGESVLDDAALEAGGAHGRVGDGWVYAIDDVDALEELLRAAHAQRIAGIAYLVGGADVLPLPDASVTAILGSPLAGAADPAEAARELYRVLRAGGHLSVAGGDEAAEAALRSAGFADLARVRSDAARRLTARKP